MRPETPEEADSREEREAKRYRLRRVAQAYERAEEAKEYLDLEIQDAILNGMAFTDLGRATNSSEAAVRQRAVRKGWYEAGTRRSR